MKKHLLLVLFTLLSLGAQASSDRVYGDRAATEQVAAQLIASVDAVHPGEKIWLGVQQKIIPHWHTYWINPGDSGLPTKISWQLPDGASAGEIQWPAPTRFDLEGITNYGYADEVILLTPISLPSTLSAGTPISISAKVEWLVCAEICIPQTVELALVLPVIEADERNHANTLIEAARVKLPQPSSWRTHVQAREQKLQLHIEGAAKSFTSVREVNFFADTWGRIEHTAAQPYRVEGNDFVLELTAGDKKITAGETLNGLIKITGGDGSSRAFIIAAPQAGAAVNITQNVQSTELGLFSALLLALLGGIILNLMPCVFPVLSIKAVSLIKHSTNTPQQNRLQGLTYTAGVLLSFLVLALLLIVLKAGGAQFGWGFQYQSPLFVVSVAYLLFAVGLNLSGVFEFGTSVTGAGSSLASKSGYAGSFFTGVLAAIVATPCTAPFMGAAIGFALSQPAVPLIAIFLSLGFGLALPYLLLTFWPQLQRRLPKPGRWMDLLKQALAFPMYAAAVWLIWVLAQQTSADAVAFALSGMVLIALAAWLYKNSQHAVTWGRSIGVIAAAIAVIAAIVSGYVGTASGAPTANSSNNLQPHGGDAAVYSAQRLQELRSEGKPVFVNLTAAWCISCLVNERVALQQDAVVSTFAQQGIVYLKGDWTNRDTEITAKLTEFRRSGVPLYLYFPPHLNAEPIVLPQILTPDIVLSAINSANSSALTATASAGSITHQL